MTRILSLRSSFRVACALLPLLFCGAINAGEPGVGRARMPGGGAEGGSVPGAETGGGKVQGEQATGIRGSTGRSDGTGAESGSGETGVTRSSEPAVRPAADAAGGVRAAEPRLGGAASAAAEKAAKPLSQRAADPEAFKMVQSQFGSGDALSPIDSSQAATIKNALDRKTSNSLAEKVYDVTALDLSKTGRSGFMMATEEASNAIKNQNEKKVNILVHGTWGAKEALTSNESWTSPNHGTYQAIQNATGTKAQEQFVWGGQDNPKARETAGEELGKQMFQLAKDGKQMNVIGHSHGGNVAMMGYRSYIRNAEADLNSMKQSGASQEQIAAAEKKYTNAVESLTQVNTPLLSQHNKISNKEVSVMQKYNAKYNSVQSTNDPIIKGAYATAGELGMAFFGTDASRQTHNTFKPNQTIVGVPGHRPNVYDPSAAQQWIGKIFHSLSK